MVRVLVPLAVASNSLRLFFSSLVIQSMTIIVSNLQAKRNLPYYCVLS